MSNSRQSRFASAMADTSPGAAERAGPSQVEVANPVYASPQHEVPSFMGGNQHGGAHYISASADAPDSFSLAKAPSRSRFAQQDPAFPVSTTGSYSHMGGAQTNPYSNVGGAQGQPSTVHNGSQRTGHGAPQSESQYEEEYLLERNDDDDEDEEAPLKPNKKRVPPVLHRWNIIPCFFFIWFLGASVYYCYVRVTMLTNSYAVVIFIAECVGWTSFLPYALLIMRGVYPTGSPGLPPVGSAEADEQVLNSMITSINLSTPPLVDLTGGLLVTDHVKYNVPIAYSVSMLAWAFMQFPKGLTGGAPTDSMLATMREGADYLMRCFIEMGDGTAVYVAQVGDGADYVVDDDDGYDPVGLNKIWTSPDQDAQLAGNAPRKAWLMTRGRIGADLLADVAAALAATSMVFKDLDEAFSYKALTTAEKIYQFATIDADAPKSYCDYVPCTVNITYTKQVLAREYVPPIPGEPLCYYLDWNEKACYLGMTLEKCTEVALVQKEVYKDKSACCNAMHNTGLWELLSSKSQGICAVPVGQDHCYIPDKSQRTCFKFPIDNSTGKGCVGAGLEVYPNEITCCNYLADVGAIDAVSHRPGTGMCSRVYRDPSFSECFVPVLNNATCQVLDGEACSAFGINSAFDSVAGCCNDMIITMQALSFNQAGGVQISTSGMCKLYFDQHLGAAGRRSLLGAAADAVEGAYKSVTGRKLFQTGTTTATTDPTTQGTATPSASSSDLQISIGSGSGKVTTSTTVDLAPVENSSYWLVPATVSKSQCEGNVCEYILVESYKEVAFFNSSSVLDDLAWAAVWMFKATNNALYMGQAQKFIARHYKEDISIATMVSDRTYYRSDWNNLAWNVNVLMSGITGKEEYQTNVELFLKTWVFGNSVNLVTPLPPATAVVDIMNVTALGNFTDPDTGKKWVIVSECTPTAKFEDNCYDSEDNNCNGFVDRDDIDCGLFPVQYTKKELAFAGFPSAPLAANAALTALMYAENQDDWGTARRLRCWALNQVSYLIGVNPTVESMVVGYGDHPPTTVQHRGSSCPTNFAPITYSNPNMKKPRIQVLPDDYPYESTTQKALIERPAVDDGRPPCNWDNAYYPSTPNPQLDLIKGALIYGSSSYYPFDDADDFSRSRSSKSARTSLHESIALMAASMALRHTETTVRSCELLHGVYQQYLEAGVL